MEQELVWVRRIQNGETQYFQQLYQKHHRKLFSLCFRFTKNVQDAEEQLQEIFMRLLDKIGQFEEKSSFSTWLHRLAVNHLLNFVKREERGAEVLALAEAPEQTTHARPDLSLILRHAVRSLPHGFRTVFVLHDQEGFPHEEIARMLGCSPANSRSQLCRARLALREKLNPYLAGEKS